MALVVYNNQEQQKANTFDPFENVPHVQPINEPESVEQDDGIGNIEMDFLDPLFDNGKEYEAYNDNIE